MGPARYPNLIYYSEADRGGHFAAWEEPELFASEVRAAFSSLRSARGSLRGKLVLAEDWDSDAVNESIAAEFRMSS